MNVTSGTIQVSEDLRTQLSSITQELDEAPVDVAVVEKESDVIEQKDPIKEENGAIIEEIEEDKEDSDHSVEILKSPKRNNTVVVSASLVSMSRAKPQPIIASPKLQSKSKLSSTISAPEIFSTAPNSTSQMYSEASTSPNKDSAVLQINTETGATRIKGKEPALFEQHHIRCSFCMDIARDARGLPCGHAYCRACLELLARDSDGRSRAMVDWMEDKRRTIAIGSVAGWNTTIGRTMPINNSIIIDHNNKNNTNDNDKNDKNDKNNDEEATKDEDDDVPKAKPFYKIPNKRRITLRSILFISGLAALAFGIKAYLVAIFTNL